MREWAPLGLQHIPRQEEAALLQAKLNGERRVEGRCFTIPFLCTRLKSQVLGFLWGVSVLCSQGTLRHGEGRCPATPPPSRERGVFARGKVMGMETGDVKQQGRL